MSRIARLTVVDGTLTEHPLAEKVRGGWQNGVTFYPDEKVTKVTELRVMTPGDAADYEDIAWRLSCLLDEQTGGLLSKTNYPVSVMSQQIDEYHDNLTEEDRAEYRAIADDALEANAVLGVTVAAIDEYLTKLPTQITYVPVPHLRNILAGRRWHEDAPRCICTPAIAGISDGPNVDCPVHGAAPTVHPNGSHRD
jgi:hypothetical protein